MKKKTKNGLNGLAWAAFLTLSLSSCLKSGLDELPAFTDTQIVTIFTEYRFKDPVAKNADGSQKVLFVNLPVTRTTKLKENTPGAASDSVLLAVTVPPVSGAFTEQIRSQVSAQNLTVYCNISTAATIVPLAGASQLGVPGDYSAPRQYQVTAADGVTSRIWTIKVAKLTK